MSARQRYQFHPGRLRQGCVGIWVVVTGFGLYHLLGLTGLALAAVYVTAGLRHNRRCRLLELTLAGSETDEGAQARGNGSARSQAKHSVPLTKRPLIGRPLRCWICPWCVAVPDQQGNLQWVCVDEVAPKDFASIRRTALLPGYGVK
ncbi:MAG: hypothetical protein VW867_04350 [Gammaproteobacteria bacterium]